MDEAASPSCLPTSRHEEEQGSKENPAKCGGLSDWLNDHSPQTDAVTCEGEGGKERATLV
eukprot:160208-Hanusia_phi.AAC.1